MVEATWLLLLVVTYSLVFKFEVVLGDTNPYDTAVLRSVMSDWTNTPPSWGATADPCGTPWEGVTCIKSRVTTLRLASTGLKGTLSGDISLLPELETLDLSYNKNLTGPLTPSIGNLKELKTLILVGCSFSGTIPSEMGKLSQLYYLALNSNYFTGKIPDSLGNLSHLFWLDVTDNQLTGTLPVSSDTSSGLDKLIHTKHFHFGKNQLSGDIPEKIFNSEMKLVHILFDSNQFTGSIPDTIGLVRSLVVLNLANNQLTGVVPDLTGMISLRYVDLSKNPFDASEAPTWFTELPSLTTLVIESGGLTGEVPQSLLSIPQLQQVKLRRNSLNGTLDMSGPLSQQLQLVDLRHNNISNVTRGSGNSITIRLIGNPICNDPTPRESYCQLQQQSSVPYSTNLAICGPKSCPQDQSLIPWSCTCAYPYRGIMYFKAPDFSDLTSNSTFQSLETSLSKKLGLHPGSVYLTDPFFNTDNYMQVQVEIFPSDDIYFNRSEILRLGFYLSNQTFKPPSVFVPFYFLASPYPFTDDHGKKNAVSKGVIAGIAAASTVLAIGLLALGHAFRQKRSAERATELSRRFGDFLS